MPVEFKEIYKIGISKIDNQHKELFSIFNQLEYELKINEGGDAVGECLDFLIRYCKEHFETEEYYFEKYNYPNRYEHQQIHREFVDEVETLYQQYMSGYLIITLKIQETLIQWIKEHIQQTDKRYGKYLLDKIKGKV